MKHVGVRPEHLPLESDTSRRRTTWYENFPDGSYKIWTAKTLNSGCGEYITEVKENDSLLYCPYCKEWANKNQFLE